MTRLTQLQLSIAVVAALVAGTASANLPTRASYEEWAVAFGKEPVALRRSNFHANVALIQDHNAKHDRGETSYRMGLNAYADLTAAEWKSKVVGKGFNSNSNSNSRDTSSNVVFLPPTNATAVDWRTKGVVTPVKSEGTCGSCWAMSATQAIESAYAIATGSLRSLSVQQVLACSLDCAADSCGCNGGLPSAAYKYVVKNGGLDSEDDYNYTGIVIPCDALEAKRVVAKIDGYTAVPQFNDTQLLAAVAQQPISVGIDASSGWQFYASGVFDNTTESSAGCNDVDCLNHAVLIIGFGTDNGPGGGGKEYWTVKNAWGTSWGENGYIRMIRNFSDGYGENNGLDGINVMPQYPTVPKGPAVPVPPPTPFHTSPRPASWCNNCGATCEYQCKNDGLKCDSQTGGTCNCMDPTKKCSGTVQL